MLFNVFWACPYGSGFPFPLFFFINCLGFKPEAIDKEKRAPLQSLTQFSFQFTNSVFKIKKYYGLKTNTYKVKKDLAGCINSILLNSSS